MTDRERLLRAILDNPEEDTPRLMYADEVEADQPHRAEFIRVACELARTPETVETVEDWPVEVVDGDTVRLAGAGFGADFVAGENVTYSLRGDTLTTTRRAVNPEYKRLCDRRNELCGPANCRLGAWLDGDPLPAVSGHTGVSWRVMEGGGTRSFIRVEFRRGFVERVTCSGDDWARHGDDILAAHPVRKVTLTSAVPFEDLDAIHGWMTDDGVRLVLSARWPRIPPEGWAFAPPQERVHGTAIDENGNWVVSRTEDGRLATDVYSDPYSGT